MNNHQSIRIERKPAVLNRMGLSHATLYRRINEGLFPPGISLGKHAVGWLAHEVDTMLMALAAGKSTDELRATVNSLIEKRKNPTS